MTRFSKRLCSITYAVGIMLSVRRNRNMRQHPGQWLALEESKRSRTGEKQVHLLSDRDFGVMSWTFRQWFNRELAEAPALWALEVAPERNRSYVWQTGNYVDTPTAWMNCSCKIIKQCHYPFHQGTADFLRSHLSPGHVWITSHHEPNGHLGCHRLFS